MNRKYFIVIAVVLILTMALTACGTGTQPSAQPGEPITIVETVIVEVEVPGEAAPAEPVAAETEPVEGILSRVLERGYVVCGGRTDLAGFGMLDADGNNLGFDIDFCRAVAAAVFGDGDAVEVVPLTAADRGPALQTAEVDILSRNATWTSSRESQWGNFTNVMFYDGQGFMIRKDSGITSTEDFDGATVCVTSGTTTEQNLSDFFRQNGMEYEAVIFEDTSAVYSAYDEGRCDITTSDKSQ
ncbi:MAG: transporter substrate-binding domain-containing protein, partial [Anaerolineales bacterium]|nr:transporter substrate-binding domain-containing protein [Anaerolineales bacterium]